MIAQKAVYRSIILAGERTGGSSLTRAFDISASVMVPVAGKPALEHVIKAISDSRQADGGIICGPSAEVVANNEELNRLVQLPDFMWLAPASGPASSAISALKKLDHFPALLTAGDHALLTGEIVDDFCLQALSAGMERPLNEITAPVSSDESNYDFVIGFVPYTLVKTAWPESKRTLSKFSNGDFCGSNLFAVLNPEGLKALEFWRQAEADRKRIWRIARRFGPVALLRYLFRRMTIEDAMRSFSKAAGCQIGHVKVNFARAAVDVDSIADQQLAEKIMSGEG